MRELDAILIAGPTASGKSALAMELAARHDGVVVNADSMQVYDALRILTARPSEADTARVDHRLYGHVPAEESYSTGAWYRDAAAVVEEVRRAGRIPIFVGGTGLYFRALLGGLSEMPQIPSDLRQRWRTRLAEEGAEALHERLAECDAAAAQTIRVTDGQRIVRALEVFDATGRSILSFHRRAGHPLVDTGRTRKLLMMPDRVHLHERIEERFHRMIAEGALDEVRALVGRGLSPDLPVMKAIGMKELYDLIINKFTVAEAEMRSIAATRQYAKRQMTWFRNQLDDSWTVIGGAGDNPSDSSGPPRR